VFATTIAPPVSEKHAIIFPGFIGHQGMKGEEVTSCGVDCIASLIRGDPILVGVRCALIVTRQGE
jgi:hypothetical protein